MSFFQNKRILKALEQEICRAKRFNYYIGVLIMDVAATTPRGVHNALPGITVNVRHFRSVLRNYDTVVKTKLRRYTLILPHLEESESARLVRDRIQFTAQIQDWGAINVGVAIFPIHGMSSRELIKAAEKDLHTALHQIENEEEKQHDPV